MNQHDVGEAGTVHNRDHAIQPLPADVVAQIKSSASVVSLTGVVLELLKNSLDADSTHIQVTVDFVRGACSVEDNGMGIAPSEFRHDGGLCRLYCTSKYYRPQAYHGCNGTFLASLAAVCLVHIVSRHHEHRSHNLLTAHYSRIIDRQLPARPHHEIHASHGTRVTVRNLFGNLPVRVKRRVNLTEQKSEHGRLCATLKREVTGILLGWRQPIALKIRDGNGNPLINLSAPASTPDSTNLRSSGLHSTLSLLTKANYITLDDWSLWIPTSASTPTICIKGAISLNPAPHKHVQFISLGFRSLSVEDGHNELMDEINRIFSLSSFGVVQDKCTDTIDHVRRQRDKRFKHDGYTNRQLTARKGVDRYPMFYFRIELKSDKELDRAGDKSFPNERDLQAVLGVLNAMITQWLSMHHFRPRKSRTDMINNHYSSRLSTSPTDYSTGSCLIQKESVGQPSLIETHSPYQKTGELSNRKRKRRTTTIAEKTSTERQSQPFAQWSRIKSGKASFFDTYKDTPNGPIVIARCSSPATIAPLSSNPTMNTASEPPNTTNGDQQQAMPADMSQKRTLNEEGHDEITTLTDPSTRQTFLLNARTGVVLSRPPARPLSATHASTLNEYNGRLRLTDRPHTASNPVNTWLGGFLKTWDNPVFKPTERGIDQICAQRDFSKAYPVETHNFLNTSAEVSTSKLSKAGLKHAQILAQLDRKFILISMQDLRSSSANSYPDGSNGSNILVLIDQHAADERIQVEKLLADLCKPLPLDHTHSNYRSQLGHRSRVSFVMLEKPIRFALSDQEQLQFVTYAARFADWGILFSIDASSETANSGKHQSVLAVTTLPPAISERSQSDPQVLITFLRSAAWKYADAGSSTQMNMLDSMISSSQHTLSAASWVKQLAWCPEGLVELVNSRACRSSIMFNDELPLPACEDLVRKLANCIFPFICAHGRPSMVPLVDLGSTYVESSVGSRPVLGENDKGFVATWKKWRSR